MFFCVRVLFCLLSFSFIAVNSFAFTVVTTDENANRKLEVFELSFKKKSVVIPAKTVPVSCNSSIENIFERMYALNRETGHYGGYVAQSLIRCSQFQDLWLSYLHHANDVDEYHRGMQYMHQLSSSFRTSCSYAADVVNFFNPGEEKFLKAHSVFIAEGKKASLYGFLNTFKQGRLLSEEEREKYFLEEYGLYCRDGMVKSFILDEKSLKTLTPETIYNFALLSDGTVTAALEKPGKRAYYTKGDTIGGALFAYPNHTILAGSANQILLTGGSFLFFEKEDRRLYFISNKSGHFVPFFSSLDHMVNAMEQMKVNRYTVIPVPDLDIAAVALKLYGKVQVPIALEEKDLSDLYKIAHHRWIATMESIDVETIAYLADNGSLPPNYDDKIESRLVKQRECAAYMRSAYSLFTKSHEVPLEFYQFVKQFGKLKDMIKHGISKKIKKRARRVFALYEKNRGLVKNNEISLSDGSSLSDYLLKSIAEIHFLVKLETLSADQFHTIKKWSREMGVLFDLMAEDSYWKGERYFLYRATSREFFIINEMMGLIHDNFIRKDLLGDQKYEEVTVSLEEKIKKRLNRLFDSLQISPPSFSLDLPEDDCYWLINCAKEWYHWHYYISNCPSGKDLKMYDPCPKEFLEKIVNKTFNGIESEDDQWVLSYWLVSTLRAAEYAQNALLFIDETHVVDKEIQEYIKCLSSIIHWVRYGGVNGVVDEANQMLRYMENRAIPSRQLEKYTCTDQIGFNAVLAEKLYLIGGLITKKEVSLKNIIAVRKAALSLRDILELYRHAGVKYQCYPSICYDLAKDAAERLVIALEQAASPFTNIDPVLINEESPITITDEMVENILYLQKKLRCNFFIQALSTVKCDK